MMDICNSIKFKFDKLSSYRYNTYPKLLNRLYELAQYTNDPTKAVEEWISDNYDQVKKYLTVTKPKSKLILEVRYSKDIEPGENEVPQAPIQSQLTPEERELRPESENQYISEIELKDFDIKAFGDSRLLSVTHKKEFAKKVCKSLLLFNNGNTRVVVYTSKDINDSIVQYKNKQYIKIRNYIITHVDSSFEKQDIFDKEGILQEEYLENLLSKFESFLAPLVKDNRLPSMLDQQWDNFIKENLNESQLLDAVYSYINVKYFDQLLKEEFGDIVQIDSKYLNSEVGTSIKENDTSFPVMKYNFGKDRSNSVKSWNIGEFRDALKESSKLSQLILGTVSLYDAFDVNHPKLNNAIEIAQVALAWSELRAALASTTSREKKILELQKYMQWSANNPNEYIVKILEFFSKAITNKDDVAALRDNGLSSISVNTLFSIYHELYDKHKVTLASAETRQITGKDTIRDTTQGITPTPLTQILRQDIIISLLTSLAKANYLQTSSGTSEVETSYINAANRVTKKIFDKKNSLNLEMGLSSQLERSLLVNKYDINITSNHSMEITLNSDTTYKVDTYNATGSDTRPLLSSFGRIEIFKVLEDDRKLEIREYLKNITNNEELCQSFDINPNNKEILKIFEDSDLDPDIKKQIIKDLENKVENIPSLGSINISKILKGNDLTLTELSDFLELIGNMLRIPTNTKVGLETISYSISTNSGFTLRAYLNAAIKIAASHKAMQDYVDAQLVNPNIKTFKDFASSKPYIPNEFGANGEIQIINGNESLTALPENEEFLHNYYLSQAILDGSGIKSTTKNFEGNSVANFRPTSLAAKYHQELQELKANKSSAANKTLFVQNPEMIKSMCYDTQVKLSDGTHKVVKRFSVSELLHNQLQHNFLNHYLTKGTVIIQPTVYSDKTAFVNFEIDPSKEINIPELGIKDKKLISLSSEEYELVYQHYIGEYFIRSYKESLIQFAKLLDRQADTKFYDKGSINDQELNTYLKGITHRDLQGYINAYNTQLDEAIRNYESLVAAEISKEEYLKNLGFKDSEPITLALQTSYRITKSGNIQLNELNYAYANHISGGSLLAARMSQAKIEYVEELLKNNVSFTYNDKKGGIEGIFKRISKNSDFMGDMSQEQFEKDWTSHGKLILAKNGNTPIYHESQLREDSVINPILEKYFYLDNILSANLKYALIGSEVADPDKSSKINIKNEFDPTVQSDKTPEEIQYLRSLEDSKIERLQSYNIMDLGFELENLNVEISELKYNITHKDDWVAFFQSVHLDTPNDEEAELAYKNNLLGWKEDLRRKEKLYNYLSKKYLKLINKIIASCEGAQYKRNVIVPATMTAMAVNSMVGVGKTTKMAIIEDTKASVNNVLGETDTIDARDGSAYRTAEQAILENGSLGDQAGGYELAKTIWHYLDPKTGTSLLAKWATFTITNAGMRLSTLSAMKQRKIYKQLNGIRWKGKYNLCNSAKHKQFTTQDGTPNHKLSFSKDIMGFVNSSGLYYQDIDVVYEIQNFDSYQIKHNDGSLERIYYTEEKNVNEIDSRPCVVLFDEESQEFRIRANKDESLENFINRVQEFKSRNKLHAVDSLYELHEALGGIYSVEQTEGGNYVGSENSHYAVVAFMNNVIGNVSEEKEGLSGVNQEHYSQPLKEEMIGYAANASSIKRGQFNINPESAWEGNQKLSYITLDNKNLGKQQDPDHEADEAEVTEMSQVIASLDAGGLTHNLAKQAFISLGQLAAHGMQMQADTLAQIIASKSTEGANVEQIASEIYDIIGRIFFKHYKARNELSLGASIVNAVKNKFLNTPKTDHGISDAIEQLLPMSDPNLFEQINSAFISSINGDVLKRKYRGLGTVMVPGYNSAQLFHFADTEYGYTYDDILNKALLQTPINTIKKNVIVKEHDNIQEYIFKSKFTGFSKKEAIKLQRSQDQDYYTLLPLDTYSTLNISEKTNLFLALHDYLQLGTEIATQGFDEKDIDLLESLGFFKNDAGNLVTKALSDSGKRNSIVSNYLKYEQSKQKYIHSQSWFQPTDCVNVLDSEGTILATISLDSIEDYYQFKWFFSKEFKERASENFKLLGAGFDKIEPWIVANWDKDNLSKVVKKTKNDKGEVYKYLKYALRDDIKFQENITSPKNLRPQRVTFQIETGERYNLFDLDQVQSMYYDDVPEEKRASIVQEAMDNIKDGGKITIYGKEHTIQEGTIVNEAAELMMSNVYESTFGQRGVSLAQAHENFVPNKVQQVSIPGADFVLMTKGDSTAIITNDFELGNKFRRTNIPETISKQEDGSYTIFNESKSGYVQYEIGKLDKLSSNSYSYLNGKFYDKEGNLLEDQEQYYYIDGEIYKKLYFIEKYNYRAKSRITKVLKFNRDNIEKYYKNVNQYIAKSLKDIAKYHDYSWAQLNANINCDNLDTIQNILSNLRINGAKFEVWNSGIESMYSFVGSLKDKNLKGVNNIYETEVRRRTYYTQYLEQFHKKAAKQALQKLNLSQYVVAARIPAQSLQSYMQMKVVGYIPVKTNECMVSHFQTWLQGSDYDIDKAYILGYQFSNSGEFYDWSPLFNYSSNQAAQASLLLPVPQGIQVNFVKESGIDLSAKIKHLYDIDQQIDRLEEGDYTPEELKELFGIQTSRVLTWNKEELIAKNIDREKFLENPKAYKNEITLTNECSVNINGIDFEMEQHGKRWLIDLDKYEELFGDITHENLEYFVKSLYYVIPKDISPNIQLVSNNINKIELVQSILKNNGFSINRNAIEPGHLVKDYITIKDKLEATKIRVITDILTEIHNSNKSEVNINSEGLTEDQITSIGRLIKSHETYKIPPEDYSAVIKNSIAARIQQIVSNVRNIPLAYSPITMRALRDLADNSPKGNLVSKLVSMNPATKAIMQQQNMDGKNVISISAIGEKIFMGLSYYYNEGVLSGDEDWEQKLQFLHTSTRIKGRYNNNPQPHIITSKTDVNWENVKDLDKERILQINNIVEKASQMLENSGLTPDQKQQKINEMVLQNLNNSTKADLLISQLLSAATDNAKELILSKINSGEKLAKVYIHLLILGYSMNDIYAFMTSDAISLVDKILSPNIFNSTFELNEDRAINTLKNGYTIYNIGNIWNTIKENETIKKYIDLIPESIKGEYLESMSKFLVWNMNEEIYNTILNILSQYQDPIQDRTFEAIIKNMNLGLDVSKSRDSRESIIKDLDEFSRILAQSEETSTLGRTWMSLAKQVNPIYNEFLQKISSLENSINRMNKFFKYKYKDIKGNEHLQYGLFINEDINSDNGNTIEDACISTIINNNPTHLSTNIHGLLLKAKRANLLVYSEDKKGYDLNFKFNQFVNDPEYQKLAIDIYDLIKSQYNILDVMVKSPQYLQAMRAWQLSNDFINLAAFKSKLVQYASRRLSQDRISISKSDISRLSTYADELAIMGFLKENEFTFPVESGQEIYTEDYERVRSEKPQVISINSGHNISSFKIWVESYLIPMLQSGEDTINIGGELVNIKNGKAFADNLHYTKDGQLVYKKLDADMDNLDININTGIQYQQLLQSFNSLDSRIKDYFILYNILVSKNAPGRDRMTALFSKNINSGVLKKYVDYLAQLDMDVKSMTDDQLEQKFMKLGYYDEDAHLRLANQYSYRTTYHKGEKYIIEISRDKLPEIKVREGLGYKAKYNILNSSILWPWISGTIITDRKRMANYLQDGVISISNVDRINNLGNLLSATKGNVQENLKKAFQQLMRMNKLLIDLKCE